MSTPTPSRPAAATPTTADRARRGSRAPSSAASASFRTPTTTVAASAGGRRTPGTGQPFPTSAARTPHARAALLALDTRRAAILTPGRRQSRRKSGRYLRESPRDLLRNLSRRLAPTSQPIGSSSPAFSSDGSATGRRSMGTIPEDRTGRFSLAGTYLDNGDDDDDDDESDSIPLDRPRLSLPIDEDNDDDLRPHRSTLLEEDGDGNVTVRSIELARRTATQEQLQQARRFSRGSLGRSSFGSLRMSDYIDGFIGGPADVDDEQVRSAFFPEDAFDNLAAEQPEDIMFERLGSDERRDTLAAGRESGFGPIDVPLDGNETTFLLAPEGADGQEQEQEPIPDDTAGPSFADDADGPPPEDDGGGGDDDGGGAPFDDNFDDYGEGGGQDMWMDEPDVQDGEPVEETAAAAAAAASAAAEDAAGKTLTLSVEGGGGGMQQYQTVRGKRVKMSRHGIPYPSLPVGVVKRIAQTFAQGSGGGGRRANKLSPDTVAALSTASDWFFEQVSIDLERYAKHAGRKTIDESDMLLLMKRQRQVNAAATPFSLAQRFLPRELLQELRMVPEPSVRKTQSKRRPRMSSAPGRAPTAGQGEDVT